MDNILPRQIDTSGYTESAQGFLTEISPPDTSIKAKIAMVAAVVLLGASAYYGYRLATRPPKTAAADDLKKA